MTTSDSERKAAMAELDRLIRDNLPEEYRAKGWQYFDPSGGWYTLPFWNALLMILGEGEYHTLIVSRRERGPGEVYMRGQFVVSPQALLNMKDVARRQSVYVELGIAEVAEEGGPTDAV